MVVQIDERPEVLGRRAPTALGVAWLGAADAQTAIEQVAPKTDTSYWDRLTKERRAWDRKARPAG